VSAPQRSRAGATGPTLLIALCGLLGLLTACLWGLPWLWLWSAIPTALAALLIAGYTDGRRDTEGAQDPIDVDEALRLARDPGPVPAAPRSAAELGRQLTEDALARRRNRRNLP
jgi:hypothetical protein